MCLSDKLGRRSLYVSPGANSLLTIDDLDLTYINQAGWLHLSSFADDRQFEVLVELINRLDISARISFAPGALYASKGLKGLIPVLTRTHILFINQDEIRRLTGKDVIAGAEICLEQGCHIVAVTLGSGMRLEPGRGIAVSYVRDAESKYIIEPHSQKVVPQVDTAGAGDAFATGFIYGLLKGKGLQECGLLGDIVARLSMNKIGARQGLPHFRQLARHYRKLCNKQL